MDPLTMMLLGGGIQAGGNLIGGLISGDANRDVYRAQGNALETQLAQLGLDREQINQYMGGQSAQQLGGELNSQYDRLNQLSNQGLPTMGEFDASGYGAEEYLNPFLDFMQDEDQQAFQRASASRGAPRGGAYDLALAERNRNLTGSEYWDKAMGAGERAESRAYGRFTDKFKADRDMVTDQWGRANQMYNAANSRSVNSANQFAEGANTARNMNLDLANVNAMRDNSMQMGIGNAFSGMSNAVGQGLGNYAMNMPAQTQQTAYNPQFGATGYAGGIDSSTGNSMVNPAGMGSVASTGFSEYQAPTGGAGYPYMNAPTPDYSAMPQQGNLRTR